MNNQKGITSLMLIGILAITYLFLCFISSRGWGYMGYRGYSRGPSFWYFGGPRYYYGRNIRHGSIYRGRTYRGGGPRSGK